ncbi:MAG: protease inhibitor I42 family protein [Planctomycetota bacterium]|nr:protease inhibitor I42 family protein [Planctomycetota bacterium]
MNCDFESREARIIAVGMMLYSAFMRNILLSTTVLILLVTTSCNKDNAANPPAETITGRTPIAPQRRLICQLRDAVTGGESKTTSSNGVDTVQLGSTTTTTANVGDLLRVELQMSSGTGFEWKVSGESSNSNPAPILMPKFTWKNGTGTIVPVNAQKPGGSVLCIFEFDVSQAGSSVLTFTLARSWETGVPPADKRVLTVNVVNPTGS